MEGGARERAVRLVQQYGAPGTLTPALFKACHSARETSKCFLRTRTWLGERIQGQQGQAGAQTQEGGWERRQRPGYLDTLGKQSFGVNLAVT